MALTFPASPNENDTHTEGSITYKWDGDKWIGLGVTPSDRLVDGSNSLEINASNNLIWTGNNVGINVTDPDSILETVSPSTNGINAHIGGLYNDGGQNAVRRIEFGVKNYRNAIQSQQGSGGNNFSSDNDLLLNPSGGNVGIGHTAANGKLQVNTGTNSAVGDSTNPALQIGGTTTYRLGIFTTNEQAIIANKNGDDGIAFHTKTGKLDGTFGQAVQINSDGNVLMGGLTTQQTSVDSSKLAIQGGDSNIGIIQVHSGGGETSGDLAGIAFSHGTDNETARAKVAIASRATGAYGKGHLCFYVDGANDDFQVSDADEKMRIANDGNVTTPEQFQIEVSRTDDQTGYNSLQNFGTPMIFDNVVSSRGATTGALDTSTGKVTVPVDGVYFLEASAFTSSGNIWQQAWFTEGNSRMQNSDWTTNNQAGANKIQVCGMHYLPANTEVGFKPYGNSTNVTIGDSVYHTWFRVTLIS